MAFTHITKPYDGNLNFNQYPFELSEFQKWSIDSWHNDKNVTITAHTGSGKTLPAEHAINQIITKKLGKAIYTSPIKSLSNDKYNSLKAKFPNTDIGIITGDIKFNPNADVLIMTTEILRNLLYNNKIEDVKNKITIHIDISQIHTVIFDEVHYINDIDRGTVWEECFILLPSKINLINLSATIDNPEHFCTWLAKIKNKDIILTTTEKRIVPLTHSIFLDYLHSYMKKKEGLSSIDFNNKLITISDSKNHFNIDNYSQIINHLKKSQFGLSKNQVINNLVEYLDINTQLPAIFFVFSRKNTEKLANSIQHTLLRDKEESLVDKIIDTYLKKTNNYDNYITMNQFQQLKKCLHKGVAFHHSGLLPIFKELVEILFSYKNDENLHQPLVKVLFATETFAVGVNMPTKTVVFTDVKKFSNNETRYLRSYEYQQMAGRAGRRGIDQFGSVILIPNLFTLPNENIMKSIMIGKSQVLESKFKTNYKIVLKSILNNVDVSNLTDQSLVNKELLSQITLNQSTLSNLECPEIDIKQIEEYYIIKNNSYGLIKPSKKTIKANLNKIKLLEKSSDFQKQLELYKNHKPAIDKRNAILNEIKLQNNYQSWQIESIKHILMEYKFIEKCNTQLDITTLGIVASEISECNELTLSLIIFNNYLDDLNYKQLATLLSLFGDSKILDDSCQIVDRINLKNEYIYSNIISYAREINSKLSNAENYRHLYINTNWEINTDIMDPTYEWLSGEEFDKIIDKYKIYEGNLIKDFIKIYNLSANLITISKLLNKSNLEIEANKIMDHILKGVVTIESLYIN